MSNIQLAYKVFTIVGSLGGITFIAMCIYSYLDGE